MIFSLPKEEKRPASEEAGRLAAGNSKGKVTKPKLQEEDRIVNVVYAGLTGLGIDEALEIFNPDFIGQHKVYEEKIRTLVKRGLLKMKGQRSKARKKGE